MPHPRCCRNWVEWVIHSATSLIIIICFMSLYPKSVADGLWLVTSLDSLSKQQCSPSSPNSVTLSPGNCWKTCSKAERGSHKSGYLHKFASCKYPRPLFFLLIPPNSAQFYLWYYWEKSGWISNKDKESNLENMRSVQCNSFHAESNFSQRSIASLTWLNRCFIRCPSAVNTKSPRRNSWTSCENACTKGIR